MDKETTVCFMKPDRHGAFPDKEFIMSKLKNSGLVIARRRTVVLTEEALRRLYPKLSVPIWQETLEHLKGQSVPVFVLEGPSAIVTMVHIVGNSYNPALCAKSSIRYRLGSYEGFNDYRDVPDGVYWFNYMYRAKDKGEAEIAINTLFSKELVGFPS